MTERTWFITGINSGFGRQLSEQILAGGGRVAGTVRRAGSVDDLKGQYGDALWVGYADVTDAAQIRSVVDAAFAALGPIDAVVANAGYGLFGAAEEFTDTQVEQQISTNLLGSIWTVRAALPHLRAQAGGRIIQFSSVAGLIANAGGSIYHASKWGVEGFAEALAEEVAPFGIEVTIVAPGGARTSFAHGSLQLAEPMTAYDGTPASFLRVLKDGNIPIIGDPAKMAATVIATLDQDPAPLRLVLGSDSYAGIVSQLQERLAQILPQQDSAARTDADD
ncbi:SDR family oxidoreductase [Gordonia sp. ABSL11-1]|uniref:SDR family oxidoreductase n=1 Tax=Gordonia sp. ABSL11-1 TaxID=3053924 RepID=UPI0025729CEC|nr:SDR family oxidoreductase [Gordonia sp. ABSL11-1]MDL9946764.1 SDR family oxidoreductase [Gordonia sp. ABSL11-1]